MGQCAHTNGGNMCKHIIHANGPDACKMDRNDSDKFLASCILNSLELARFHGVKTISIPPISTGLLGFPVKDCAEKMIQACTSYCSLGHTGELTRIKFVVFEQPKFEIFQGVFEKMFDIHQSMSKNSFSNSA